MDKVWTTAGPLLHNWWLRVSPPHPLGGFLLSRPGGMHSTTFFNRFIFNTLSQKTCIQSIDLAKCKAFETTLVRAFQHFLQSLVQGFVLKRAVCNRVSLPQSPLPHVNHQVELRRAPKVDCSTQRQHSGPLMEQVLETPRDDPANRMDGK